MKKIWLSLFVPFFFFAMAAAAQESPGAGNSQGTTGSSPAMNGQTSSPGSSGASQSENQSGMSGGQSGGMSSDKSGMKGEKKMKGCILSQGGQYMLETKKGKSIDLSGQDVSAHVGHEVAVHGMWGGSASNSMSSASSGNGADSGKTFNVTSVDMISDTCGGKMKDNSSMK